MNFEMRQLGMRSGLSRLCILSVFFAKFVVMAADGTFVFIGTVEAHQAIWAKHAEMEKAIAENQKTIANLEDQISQIHQQLDELRSHTNDFISVQKDEFETTAEWQNRLSETNKLYNAGLLRDIGDREASISELQNRIDSQDRLQKSAGEQTIGLACFSFTSLSKMRLASWKSTGTLVLVPVFKVEPRLP